ncbi:hypothetical protein [Streptomyces sp. 8L]|uniref:hypothetical protein n=1 Tax=Streptomyces sp. 8L TaxID=2877242 RepID=UPI001CD56DE4|nr:hypothetical protein [Streptomyces sp. 8L]MCA1218396.1 hypothetical protein [Streptomyces sp. 8L]
MRPRLTLVPSHPDQMAPDLEQLRTAVAAFKAVSPAVSSSVADETSREMDLSGREDRVAMLRWLNSWGCRIRYSRLGEPDLFDIGIRDWSARWSAAMVGTTARMSELTDEEIATAGECYADLVTLPIGIPGRPRSLGATAASKLLHRLRPHAFMPWDEAIARQLHGARDHCAYMAHQRLGRAWARRLLAETDLDERGLAAAVDAEDRTLPKLLDDYCYIRYTRGDDLTPPRVN